MDRMNIELCDAIRRVVGQHALRYGPTTLATSLLAMLPRGGAAPLGTRVCGYPAGHGICGAPLSVGVHGERCVREPHLHGASATQPPAPPQPDSGTADTLQRLCSVQVSYERLVQLAHRVTRDVQTYLERIAFEVPGHLAARLEELQQVVAAAPAWTEGYAAQLAQEIRCLQERNAALVARCRESLEQRAQLAEYQTAAEEIVAARKLFERAEARLRGAETTRQQHERTEHLKQDAATRCN